MHPFLKYIRCQRIKTTRGNTRDVVWSQHAMLTWSETIELSAPYLHLFFNLKRIVFLLWKSNHSEGIWTQVVSERIGFITPPRNRKGIMLYMLYFYNNISPPLPPPLSLSLPLFLSLSFSLPLSLSFLIYMAFCQLQTDTQHAKRKWRGIKAGKEKYNLKDDWKTRKSPNMWRWEKRQLILALGPGSALPR